MNKTKLLLSAFALCSMLALSCASVESANKSIPRAIPKPVEVPASSSSAEKPAKPAVTSEISAGQLVDSRDGKKYRVVTIGSQMWMAENLNYNLKGSKCYGNDASNCDKHGRLYGWETISEENLNICPSGWHLPKNTEWKSLVDHAGGEKNAAKKLKAKEGWNAFDGKDGNGTDDYGFSAFAGGHGDYESNFRYIGDISFWWSNSEDAHSEFANSWYINSRGNVKGNDFFGVYEAYYSFVRCVMD
jgi:uncharacterized protein (TIGR02145 family)